MNHIFSFLRFLFQLLYFFHFFSSLASRIGACLSIFHYVHSSGCVLVVYCSANVKTQYFTRLTRAQRTFPEDFDARLTFLNFQHSLSPVSMTLHASKVNFPPALIVYFANSQILLTFPPKIFPCSSFSSAVRKKNDEEK